MPTQNNDQVASRENSVQRGKNKVSSADDIIEVVDSYSRAGRATIHQYLPLAHMHRKKEREKLAQEQGGSMN